MTRLEEVAVVVAAAVCLLFTGTLRDVPGATTRPRAPAPATQPGRDPADAVLRVSVFDEEWRAAPGVRLSTYRVAAGRVQPGSQASTGRDGTAVLAGLPRGETWLLASRADLARTSSHLLLQGGERSVTLWLRTAALFEVVVVDARQRPIRNVRVTLYGPDPLPHVAATDASGLARLGGLGPPPYAVEVVALGYDAKLVPRLERDDSPLFVKLERPGGLAVEVVDPAGKPASGATVLVAGATLWPARRAATDPSGRVVIGALGRGLYDLRAELGQLVSDVEQGVLLEQGEVKQVRLALLPGTSVTVSVSDGEGAAGRPVANADVALVEGGLSSFPRYGRTDASGTCVLGPIAGGDATVSAQAEGFVPRSAVPLGEGQREIRLVLLRGGVLLGRVVDDRDLPIEGASLEVVGTGSDGMPIVDSSALAAFREEHFAFVLPGAQPLVPVGELGVMPVVPDLPRAGMPALLASAPSGSAPWASGRDGSFRLGPVTPGRVQLRASHPSFVDTLTAPVELRPGAERELTVVMRRGGVLQGRVLEHDRRPAAGARVELAAGDGMTERITFAADDGSFAFAAVPAEVMLSVARPEAPELLVERLELSLPPQARRQVEIVLPEARAPVAFRVVDDRGYAVDRAELVVSSLAVRTPLVRTLFADDRGETELPGARDLPLRVMASRHGHAPTVLELEAAPAAVTVTLGRALAARGEVTSRTGAVADASVVLMTALGVLRTRTDPGGRFAFDDLAPGAARLAVVAEGYVVEERAVAIAGDVLRPVDLGRIEVTRGGGIEGVVVDWRGDPVPGARVAVGRVPTYLPLGPTPLGVALTDARGRFVLSAVLPGTTAVEALAIGYGRDAVAGVRVQAGEVTRDLRIELREDALAAGELPDSASLAVTLGGVADRVVIEHVPFGGEAQRAGILAGDRLLSVDGLRVRSLAQARARLSGPPSQDLVLELARPPDLRWRLRVRREPLLR